MSRQIHERVRLVLFLGIVGLYNFPIPEQTPHQMMPSGGVVSLQLGCWDLQSRHSSSAGEGAQPTANICNYSHSSPLHKVSELSRGLLEVARLLLNYGAKGDEKDTQGRIPFQLASSKDTMISRNCC